MPTLQELKDGLLWALCGAVLELAPSDKALGLKRLIIQIQMKEDEEESETMTAQRSVHVNPGQTIRFNYTNYKLETEWRRARVEVFWFGSSTYHTGEQWFCYAYCLDRNDYRNFALRDMRDVSVVAESTGP